MQFKYIGKQFPKLPKCKIRGTCEPFQDLTSLEIGSLSFRDKICPSACTTKTRKLCFQDDLHKNNNWCVESKEREIINLCTNCPIIKGEEEKRQDNLNIVQLAKEIKEAKQCENKNSL